MGAPTHGNGTRAATTVPAAEPERFATGRLRTPRGEGNTRPVFHNREEAARRLAAVLKGRRLHDPLVVAIPRGGVILGAVLARELGTALDFRLCQKLRAPGRPDLAIGAIAEGGRAHLGSNAANYLTGAGQYLREERRHLREMGRRLGLLRAARPREEISGRSVIVADDGIATGSTMIAALKAVRAERPRELIVAVPAANPDRLQEVARWCDDEVCLLTQEDLATVGDAYEDFDVVEDDEAAQVLREFAPTPTPELPAGAQ